MFIICPINSTVIVYQVQKKHEFYEWDKIERLKKRKFIFKLFFLVQFFTYLSAFNLICTATFFSDNQKYIVNNFIIISYIFYTLLFILNSLFPVRLHKKYFDDELIQNNHLASKPENWDWEYIERNSFY